MRNFKLVFNVIAISIMCIYTSLLRGQQLDVSLPNGELNAYQGFELFEVSDSLIGVFYLVKKPNEWEETIKIYHKANLKLEQSFTHSSTPLAGFRRIHAYTKENGTIGFFLNNYLNDTNYITIHRYHNGTLSPNVTSFKFSGDFASGLKYYDDELFIMSVDRKPSDTSSGTIDYFRIQVRDTLGNFKREKFHNSHSKGFSEAPLNISMNTNPKIHPLSGDLVFCQDLACNYTVVSRDSLAIVHSNFQYVTGSEIVPAFIPQFEVLPEGIECGGFGIYLKFENGQISSDEQFFHATKSWGTDTAKPRMFGPANINNRGYAFAIEKSSGTRFLAGSVPFDFYVLAAEEYREMLIYRFTEFGTDSLLLYGNSNHVPLELFPDPLGDLFILSTYTDAWTTDSTHYVLTKIPSYSISNSENPQVLNRIQFYPNPAQDYVNVEGLIGKAVEYSVFTQTGQLIERGTVKEERIDVRQLKSGIYILKFKDGQGSPFQVIMRKI